MKKFKVPAEKIKLRAHAIGVYIRRRWASKKTGHLTFAQVCLGCVALIGISYYSVPIALIIAGVVGIVAVERQNSGGR